MLYVRMPKERVAVLIGSKGEAKQIIEERTGVKIEIESKTGDVSIQSENDESDFNAFTARDIVKAIARGFSPERAMTLVKEDIYLDLIDIRDYSGKSSKHVRRIRGRLIGSDGKTRRIIEELSEAELSIYGNTVGIIGDIYSLDIAKRATQMILEGSEHSVVYRYLERRKRDLKMMEMGMQ